MNLADADGRPLSGRAAAGDPSAGHPVSGHSVAGDGLEPCAAADASRAASAGGAARHVLVVEDDRALLGLLDEWLAELGCRVVPERAGSDVAATHYDLIIVDVPFPRQGGHALLQRVAKDYPKSPILALSSSFFSGIDNRGGVARALGVAYALPKPVKRDALITAVKSLLPPAP